MVKFPVTQGVDPAPARMGWVDDETLELKMTPLLDVIFQLIIFLMCALHFRSLDAKLEPCILSDKEMKSPQANITPKLAPK